MARIATFLMVIASTGLAACQNFGLTEFKKAQISIKGAPPGPHEYTPGLTGNYTIGSVLIWSNDVNAAVIYNTGDICAQRAMTALTADTGFSASLSDALVKLNAQGATPQTLADVRGTIEEVATRLSTTTERTAFLDIGMFYTCQLAANKAVTADEAEALTKLLITSAAGMKPSADQSGSDGGDKGDCGQSGEDGGNGPEPLAPKPVLSPETPREPDGSAGGQS